MPEMGPLPHACFRRLARQPCLGYRAFMDRPPVLLVADRSRLAANLYTLLFAPLGVNLLIRRSLGHALDYLKAGGAADLLVASSNSLGSDPESAMQRLESISASKAVPKILLCKESAGENVLRQRLSSVTRAIVLTRPFHPDDMFKAARKLIKGGAG